jgi:serine/threonine-protein kinase
VAGVVFAKPGYVAPEVANGDPGDYRVDLYAAGVMIWELCAGRRFLQGDAQTHMSAVAAGKRELPSIAGLVGASTDLDRVLGRMTVHDREARYRTTREAATQLAGLLRHAPSLPNGERGARARVAQLMYNLYPSQPGRSRREFARLVADARTCAPEEWQPQVEIGEHTPEPSDMLAGTRYRLRREIGRGASSIVYEGEHVDLGRPVAIKLLDAEHTHSLEFAARFRREARALSRLHHPGLVRVFDFGQSSDGQLFCAMELLEGATLRERLDRGEPVDVSAALRIARQACLALQVAHRHHLVHRDIKPDNLFITDDGHVKIIDFGLAKGVDELGEGEERTTLGAMTLFGTPEYMAPEQVATGEVDARADLYALGCVLYEMLTGRLPFVADSAVAVLEAKLKGNPEPARERAPNRQLPRSVDRLVTRALARHPTRRFRDAGDMADALAEALDEPSRRRNRRRTIGGALVAALMAFGLVLLVGQAKPMLARLHERLPWLQPSAVPEQRPARPPEREGTRPRPASEPRPSDVPGAASSERRGASVPDAPVRPARPALVVADQNSG